MFVTLHISCPIAKGMRYVTIAHNLFSLTAWQYIEAYTRRHSRYPAWSGIVFKIDNIRSGIFLNKITHITFGENVAFITVLNALMLLDRSLMALISRHLTLP